ncbi:hypothetical protein J2X46_003703 [Nocardioides sp. BE266]|uniref:hypothetical protein n=1 Tax=Nocardioides sp. BE266 TaxID=2817725 RepID=UPI002861304A|nr:hypothetical protein [Nocardioides sp. BE266]MDR7254705.1 hypothetical protein [Nocardioides sp. BE266]
MFLLAMLVSGIAAMAALEGAKSLLHLRGTFHAREFERVASLSGRRLDLAAVLNPPEATAPRLVGTVARLDVPLEQLCAQLSAGMEASLNRCASGQGTAHDFALAEVFIGYRRPVEERNLQELIYENEIFSRVLRASGLDDLANRLEDFDEHVRYEARRIVELGPDSESLLAELLRHFSAVQAQVLETIRATDRNDRTESFPAAAIRWSEEGHTVLVMLSGDATQRPIDERTLNSARSELERWLDELQVAIGTRWRWVLGFGSSCAAALIAGVSLVAFPMSAVQNIGVILGAFVFGGYFAGFARDLSAIPQRRRLH